MLIQEKKSSDAGECRMYVQTLSYDLLTRFIHVVLINKRAEVCIIMKRIKRFLVINDLIKFESSD